MLCSRSKRLIESSHSRAFKERRDPAHGGKRFGVDHSCGRMLQGVTNEPHRQAHAAKSRIDDHPADAAHLAIEHDSRIARVEVAISIARGDVAKTTCQCRKRTHEHADGL